MNYKTLPLLATCLVLSGQANCEERQPLTQEEMRSVMDRASTLSKQPDKQEGYGGLTKEQINDAMDEAVNSAKGGRRGSMKNLPMTLPDGNRKVDIPDPAKMAEQMKDAYAAMMPEDNLMIFVSTSMPAATLKLLGEQANRAGGILILRGFKGGMKKGALQATLKAMRPVAEGGGSFNIDPEAFTRFDVQVVPTFVLAAPVQGCKDTPEQKCSMEASKLVGDVSLDYALEHWVKRGGRAGSIAEKYLNRMQRRQGEPEGRKKS
jgi:conjugal transfer pilus assembly protein TrbC